MSNRDQFAVTQVTIEVMKRSRNPPRFEKDRYEGFIYSNSVPESLILRDRSTYRPFRVRARDEDFASVSGSIHRRRGGEADGANADDLCLFAPPRA